MSSPNIDDETALLIVSCAAAIHQQLYLVIDLLNEQARVLKRLVGKRIRPTNDERRRPATLAKKLDRRILKAQELIVTVDTFQRWHRQLIAATYSAKRTGRPRLDAKTEALIVQMANDNPTWGEDSIRDRLADLGITVSDRTITNVLKRHGIPSAPQRSKTNDWRRFIASHWPHLAALDFASLRCRTERAPDGIMHSMSSRLLRDHCYRDAQAIARGWDVSRSERAHGRVRLSASLDEERHSVAVAACSASKCDRTNRAELGSRRDQ